MFKYFLKQNPMVENIKLIKIIKHNNNYGV